MKKYRMFFLTTGIFVLFAVLFIIIESYPNFPDADSFYHAKMAVIIRDQGFIKTFPWFQETIFTEHYVDHHLLYHLLLIPFVTIFNPLTGIKVAAVIFALMALGGFYFLLRTWKIPWAPWLTLAAGLSVSFFQRLALPRAPSLSLLCLLLGTWALVERKPRWLLVIAAVFVWLYNGWPLLAALIPCLIIGKLLTRQIFSTEQKFWGNFAVIIKEERKIILALLIGLGLGLISHPYFPENLKFSILHILQIGFFNATNTNIPVGTEWYPPNIWWTLMNNPLIVLIIFLTGATFLPMLAKKDQKKLRTQEYSTVEKILVISLMTAGTIIFTLKSQRYFEYSIPFVVLTAGLFLALTQDFFQQEIGPELKKLWQGPIKKTISISFVILIIALSCHKVWGSTKPIDDYFQAQQFAAATNWIKEHVPANTTIFHNCWDYAPILWYLDDTYYYLVGLDPMFMVDKNPERFQLWLALSQGRDTDVEKIISEFNAPVVVVDNRMNDAETLIKNLLLSGLFTEVTSNEWVRIFATNEFLYENSHNSANS